ncbi:MAG: hypothetical protein LBJ84_05480 [Oscillospiraceae bacterium]|nr:hypothetical protein [Oscillospiraceae bacterium]
MRLIYGTTNQSKILIMKRRVEPLGIEILSLGDVNAPDLHIDESGGDPLENAGIKALVYYRALRMPVFSCDSGLYIEGFDDARQPGVHVRSIDGRRLDDDEMIAYYSALAAESGGSMIARYRNAICLVLNERRIYKHMGDDIAGERFIITSKAHKNRSEGFPLDSLSVHIKSGKYYYDMDDRDDINFTSDNGFTAFFQRVMRDGIQE